MRTIAIMQPYWAPFRGYFRLFSETDEFVVLDCAQFPRRGWVHRNRLLDRNGTLQWLTLPVERAPQDTSIEAMKLAADGPERMGELMKRFPAFDHLPKRILDEVRDCRGALVTYNMRILEACCWEMGIPFKVAYSSALNLQSRGQDRIIEICERTGATRYLNAPGGAALYDAKAFAQHGIELAFLPPWTGRMDSILELLSERVAA